MKPELPTDDVRWQSILDEVAPLAARFVAGGFRIFLVGGVVRDVLAGTPPRDDEDLDFTTDARPEQTKALVADWAEAVWTQGERFGTIGCSFQGREFEITTHRAESYDPASRKPDVEFSTAIEQDLARRDFTVNAMAVEVPVGQLVDPFAGARDLGDQVLRTPLDPSVSFTDDPLRMLRAARFIARLNLVPVPELLAAVDEFVGRMAIVSAERIHDEVLKLLGADDPAPGLEFLLERGVIEHVAPGYGNAGLRAGVNDAVAAVAALSADDPELRLAALLAIEPGAVASRLKHLKFSRRATRRVGLLIEGLEWLVGHGGEIDDPELRRWALRLGPERENLLALAAALGHAAASGPVSEGWAVLAAAEDLDDDSVPLGGAEIMALLEVGPGPEVGRAVEQLRHHRLENGPIDAAEARRILRERPV
ncbi:MAG: CCA tRNA nucleotidyltransferase [Actinomycetia bacterium]|nr:CCA tRNA nucleotidyltransferase [Actinomycetes bacterium]